MLNNAMLSPLLASVYEAVSEYCQIRYDKVPTVIEITCDGGIKVEIDYSNSINRNSFWYEIELNDLALTNDQIIQQKENAERIETEKQQSLQLRNALEKERDEKRMLKALAEKYGTDFTE